MIQLFHKTYSESSELTKVLNHHWEELLKRDDLGFFKLPERASLWESSQKRANEIIDSGAKSLAVVGIGGSSLGGRALTQALLPQRNLNIQFFENLDEPSLLYRVSQMGPKESIHWVFISKSGSTMETLALLDRVSLLYEGRLKTFCTVITESKPSLLHDWAQSQQVPVLEIPLDVGGRFSVLSPVGLLMAALQGHDLGDLQKGALRALSEKDLVLSYCDQSIQGWQQNKDISLFWSYTERLGLFGEWLVQLWAESLGKEKSGLQGSTPVSAVGPSVQHSVLQQVMDGPKNKWVNFIKVSELESQASIIENSVFGDGALMSQKSLGDLLRAETHGTLEALREGDIPCLGLEVPKLNAENMGFLFMFFQLSVALLGSYLGINAFDQPGVELSKKRTRENI